MRPFELERWYVKYEFNVENNISASCATPTSTRELLALAGPEAGEAYLRLELDYIPNPGTPPLREAIAGWYETISPEHVQVTTGASEAILLVMRALVRPGDTVVALSPAYQSLHEVAVDLGANLRLWELRESDAGWLLDLDELGRLLAAGARAVVVNFPHNPTGFMATPAEQREIARLAEAAGAVLISDEVYRGLVYEPADVLPPAADLSENAVSIGDMTKPFGLGGLRVGWVASRRQDILDAVSMLRDYTTMCSSAPSEFLATIALRHKETLFAAKLAVARENRERFARLVAEHKGLVAAVLPRGGVTAFPAYDLPLPSREFCEGLSREEGVLLLPGYVYGVERHFRIGFSRAPEFFEAGLAALARYLKRYA